MDRFIWSAVDSSVEGRHCIYPIFALLRPGSPEPKAKSCTYTRPKVRCTSYCNPTMRRPSYPRDGANCTRWQDAPCSDYPRLTSSCTHREIPTTPIESNRSSIARQLLRRYDHALQGIHLHRRVHSCTPQRRRRRPRSPSRFDFHPGCEVWDETFSRIAGFDGIDVVRIEVSNPTATDVQVCRIVQQGRLRFLRCLDVHVPGYRLVDDPCRPVVAFVSADELFGSLGSDQRKTSSHRVPFCAESNVMQQARDVQRLRIRPKTIDLREGRGVLPAPHAVHQHGLTQTLPRLLECVPAQP